MSIRCVTWPENRSVAIGTALFALLTVACSDDSYRLGGERASAVSGASHSGLCADGAELEVLDQMEDGDGAIEMIAQRSGDWVSFNDKTGGVQVPEDGAETFVMSELVPPRSGSHYAARSHGGGFTLWGAGIGFELYSQKAYDLSSYAGITFWARRGPDTASSLRFGVTDSATAPRGGQCQKCSDYFGSDVSLDTEFQRYSFTWDELKQGGWGEPKPEALNTSQVYGVRFQMDPVEAFDFWIDDIALLCHAD